MKVSQNMSDYEVWFRHSPHLYDVLLSQPTCGSVKCLRWQRPEKLLKNANLSKCKGILVLEGEGCSTMAVVEAVIPNTVVQTGELNLDEFENTASFKTPKSRITDSGRESNSVFISHDRKVFSLKVTMLPSYNVEDLMVHPYEPFVFYTLNSRGSVDIWDYTKHPSSPSGDYSRPEMHLSPETGCGGGYLATIALSTQPVCGHDDPSCAECNNSSYYMVAYTEDGHIRMWPIISSVKMSQLKLSNSGFNMLDQVTIIKKGVIATYEDLLIVGGRNILELYTIKGVSLELIKSYNYPLVITSIETHRSYGRDIIIVGCEDESIDVLRIGNRQLETLARLRSQTLVDAQYSVDPVGEEPAGVSSLQIHDHFPSLLLSAHCSGAVAIWDLGIIGCYQLYQPKFIHFGHIGDTGPALWYPHDYKDATPARSLTEGLSVVSAGFCSLKGEDMEQTYGVQLMQIWRCNPAALL